MAMTLSEGYRMMRASNNNPHQHTPHLDYPHLGIPDEDENDVLKEK